MTLKINSVVITEAEKLQYNRDLMLAPVSLAADTAITAAAHALRSLYGTSAVARTHTIAATGFTMGDQIYGRNKAAGTMTFVGAGFTISANATLFPSALIGQGEPFAFECDGDLAWVRIS
jgi:hypothetical protein